MEDQITSLLHKLAGGCTNTVNELIVLLLDTAKNAVRSQISKLPHLSPYEEDLQANAMMTLTEFVQGKVGKEAVSSARFKQQLVAAVRNKTYDWYRKNECTIQTPLTSQRRHDISFQRQKLREDHKISHDEELFDDLWFNEVLETLTPLEEEVLKHRIHGLSINKLKNTLGITAKEVKDTIKSIRNKLEGNQ